MASLFLNSTLHRSRRAANDASRQLPVWLALVLLVGTSLGGCSWWQKQDEPKKESPAKVEKLPELEHRDLVNRPRIGDPTIDKQLPLIKPGHQMPLGLSMRANSSDGRGTLQWQFVDSVGRPLGVANAATTITHDRSVVLPKKQWRQFELPTLAPATSGQRLQLDFRPASLGLGGFTKLQNLRSMPAQMYQLWVLANDPLDYRYLTQLTTVKFPRSELQGELLSEHYVVVLPEREQLAFPRGLMHWTTIAAVVWDDFDPSKLEPDEQQALLDWLHWGGQLIISGPDSLVTLGESFLRPYLPATGTETTTLDGAVLAPLNDEHWALRGQSRLQALKPWSGVKLEPDSAATQMLDSPLIVERRVGRGRIVVTAFRLDQRELREWTGCDGFWHTTLLRRASRRFTNIEQSIDGREVYSVHWHNGDDRDASRVTDLRLFARDAGQRFVPPHEPPQVNNPFGFNGRTPVDIDEAASYDSTGAWRDSNAAVAAAAATLADAAGIVVPERTFVTRLLGIYLVLLVPVNWLVFRVIRRVEWAWIAVPVLAVLFAGLVTHLAQVNVGFARARTEVNLVELHANHPRAHVARFNALYSSLGTAYEVLAAGVDSLALPMPGLNSAANHKFELRVEPATLPRGEVTLPATRTRGFVVSSNATGLLHVEHVHEFGTIGFRQMSDNQYEITNLTARPFTGGVVGPGGKAWLGTLPVGQKITFSCTASEVPWFQSSAAETSAAVNTLLQGIDLSRHIELATNDREPDELRLIALCDGELEGVTITPPAAQRRTASLLVVHLDFGEYGPLAFDVNYRAPIKPERAPLPND